MANRKIDEDTEQDLMDKMDLFGEGLDPDPDGEKEPDPNAEPGEGEEKKDELPLAAEGETEPEGTTEPPEGTKPDGDKTYEAKGVIYYADDGNVIAEDGTILAHTGRERRLFEKAEREARKAYIAQQGLSEKDKKISDLESQAQAHSQPDATGLTQEQQYQAFQLYNRFITDPVGATSQLLAHLQEQGYNVDAISTAGGVSPQQIKKMIEDAVAPLKESTDQQTGLSSEQELEIVQMRDDFLTRFPDAEIHEPLIARLLVNDQSLSLDGAYAKLYGFATRQGLDWAKPLMPQIAAKQQGGTQGAGEANGTQQSGTRRPASPQGGKVSDAGLVDESIMASPDASYSDIVREAMREQGMKV